MNAIIQSLRYYYELLLNSPHHLVIYVAAVAVLLIAIPLMRLIFRSRRRSETASEEVAYPSMLGLASPVSSQSAPVHVAAEPPRIPPGKVRAINESLAVPCTHCGVSMSSRQDFCPACGYAQPIKQTFTA